jgi:hypothetical protein
MADGTLHGIQFGGRAEAVLSRVASTMAAMRGGDQMGREIVAGTKLAVVSRSAFCGRKFFAGI